MYRDLNYKKLFNNLILINIIEVKMSKILIGPAGSGGAELTNFEDLKKLGLDAVEIEFTYGVWMNKEQAKKIFNINKKLGLRLSIHAPYFVNLNSNEKQKIEASKQRILKCCEIGDLLGAKNIVFHAGFYLKNTKQETYENIRKQILELQEIIKKNKWEVKLCPETTGKASQFGDLDELIQLIRDTKCSICVDFAHLLARNNGKIDYNEIMKKLKSLNQEIHCHFSGIEYTAKGERKHLLTQEKDIKILFEYINKFNLSVIIINESPLPLEDAIKMKKLSK